MKQTISVQKKHLRAALLWLLWSVCGTAVWGQTVPTLPDADELDITSTTTTLSAADAGSYMRVVLDRGIPAGKYMLLVLPARLDGYYFDATAERYRVTSYDLDTEPITLDLQEMEDRDDFEPYQLYLIKSKYKVDRIVCMEPGVSTEVPRRQTQLLCTQVNSWMDTETGIQTPGQEELTTEQIYDLAGRMVKQARHGIYIVNGKKIWVK